MSEREPRHAVRRTRHGLLPDAIAYVAEHLVATIVLAAVALLGVVGASASTLGGLLTNDLGSSTGTVAAHASGITVTWGSRWSGSAVVLDSVSLSTTAGQPFVVGEQVKTSIVGASGAELCAVSTTIAAQSTTLSLARTSIEAACGTTPFAFSSIDRIAVVASGAVAP
jgi:hypothetical protein